MKDKAEPLRQCLGCKQVRPKRELLRLTRLSDGSAAYDHAYRRGGRGGYVCPHLACLHRAFKGRHPRFSLTGADLGALVAQMRSEIAHDLQQAQKHGFSRTIERNRKLLERLSSEGL